MAENYELTAYDFVPFYGILRYGRRTESHMKSLHSLSQSGIFWLHEFPRYAILSAYNLGLLYGAKEITEHLLK